MPATSAVPVLGDFLLARDQNIVQDTDWITPSIVSFDFTNAEDHGDEKRSVFDPRDSPLTLSGLGGCLQKDGWFYHFAFPPGMEIC